MGGAASLALSTNRCNRAGHIPIARPGTARPGTELTDVSASFQWEAVAPGQTPTVPLTSSKRWDVLPASKRGVSTHPAACETAQGALQTNAVRKPCVEARNKECNGTADLASTTSAASTARPGTKPAVRPGTELTDVSASVQWEAVAPGQTPTVPPTSSRRWDVLPTIKRDVSTHPAACETAASQLLQLEQRKGRCSPQTMCGSAQQGVQHHGRLGLD